MKIKPLGNRVVLKSLPEEEVTKGGIILPDTAEKEKPEQAEVIAIGPGKLLDDGKRSEMEVSVGDKVIFSKYSPTEIKLDEEEYLVVGEEDILGIIE